MITALHAFKDNYIWAIHSPDNCRLAIVDPGDAAPVMSYLTDNNLALEAILITHHHADHTGGVQRLLEAYPHTPVYGHTQPLSEGDTVSLFNGALTLEVLAIPGHTKGHVAYFGGGMVFTGDTLFSCGCGRLFEGTPIQMVKSLAKIKALPPDTQVYCGHEYTLANIAFALHVDPKNKALMARFKEVSEWRENNKPSLPVSLKTECETNPFLRCDNRDIIESVQQEFKINTQDEVDIFAHLRKWKDHF